MKVLVVDDEPLVRKSLSRACQARGHQVQEAVDGDDGLKKWQAFGPDLVFLDVLMPGLSGPEVLRTLSANPGFLNQTVVVLMSAYSGEHNIDTAQQMGADLFVPKPFDNVFDVVSRAESIKKS